MVLRITPHERAVLQLLADGHDTLDIAAALGVSERELETGLTSLLSTIGVRSRTEAVEAAWRRGLLASDHETKPTTRH